MMLNFLTPPIFDDEDQTLVANHLFIITWTFMAVGWLALLIAVMIPETLYRWLLVVGVIESAGLTLLALNYYGHTPLVRRLLIFIIWATATGMALTGGGTSSNAMAIYFIVVLVAGLLQKGKAVIITAVLCSITGLFLAYLEYHRLLPVNQVRHTPFTEWIANSIYLAIIISLQYLVSRTIRKALKSSRQALRERQQAVADLQESEKRFRLIADYTYDWENWVGPDGKLIWVNTGVSRLTGYSVEDCFAMADFPLPIIDDRDRAESIQEYSKAVQGASVGDFEFRIRHKGGGLKWGAVSFQPIYDPMGNNIGHRSSIRDITERKQAEKALQENEERFRLLFENMTSGSAVYTVINDGSNGSDYIIKNFNKTSLKIEGKMLEDVVGKSLSDLRPNIDNYGLIPVLKKVWQTGETAFFPTRIYQDEHFSNYYENHIFKIPSGEVVTIYNDVTDRKLAEEKIKASLLEKETMLKEIHHRVKNNLQVISSLLNMQSSYLQDEKAKEIFQNSMDRVSTMAKIHTLLYQSEDLTRIDFGGFIRDLVGRLQQAYGIAGSPVGIHVNASDVSLTMEASVPCGLILNELVANALKHAFPKGKGGEVNISMAAAGDQFVLKVQDTGIGFPEAVDFQNTKSLGLELVNLLVGQMNGAITLTVEGGTTFTITFPAVSNGG